MKNWQTHGTFGLEWTGPKEQCMNDEAWTTNIMRWRNIGLKDIQNYQNNRCCSYPIERHQWVKFFSEWPNFPFAVSRETLIL